MQSRTTLYQKSFLPSVIRQLNSLPINIRLCPTLPIFKRRLSTNMQKPPTYYSVVNRRGQVLHASLRLECSSLNYDLYRKSIINDPSCVCGEVETTKHFRLSCPTYDDLRHSLFSNLPCPPTLNNLM